MRSFLFAFALALGVPGVALADPGDELLAKVDKVMNDFVDQTIIFDVLNLKPGTTTPATMQFKAVVKDGKNFTEFLAPGDVKGTRVLTTSATQMWIWLPEFGKIRKVATHTLDQGFMGTTLQSQDVGTTSFGADYDATLISDGPDEAVLQLEARNPDAVGNDHLRMTVDKKMLVPTKIEYLSDDGKVLRTQTRSGYTCPKPGYCMFTEMKMVDHTRGDAWTILKVAKIEIDTGVSADIFTPRMLQIGL